MNHIGPCNNPDGYTWNPCDSHSSNVAIGGYDCNSFDSGMQCCGFARKLAYDAYGTSPRNWGRTNINNIKAGDVMHYTGSGADLTYGHWVFVIGVNGDAITVGECNAGGNCKIRWGRVIYKSNITVVEIDSAPYELQASEGTNVKWNYMNITYNIVADMGVCLNSGVSYTYQFWASFGGKTYYSEKESFTTTWPANNNPLGAVDLIKGDTNSIYVGGWAFDSDQSTEQLAIVVTGRCILIRKPMRQQLEEKLLMM